MGSPEQYVTLVCWCMVVLVANAGSIYNNKQNDPYLSRESEITSPEKVTVDNSHQAQNGSDDPVDWGQCVPNPCLNFGICIKTGRTTYRCDCTLYRAGVNCGYTRCVHVPRLPMFLQPFYTKCSHPRICVLAFEGIMLRPRCICDDARLC